VTSENKPSPEVSNIAASVVATGVYGAMSQIDRIRENLEDQGRADTEDYNYLTTLYGNLDVFATAQGLEQFDPRTFKFSRGAP
jgi:hypothetical protein